MPDLRRVAGNVRSQPLERHFIRDWQFGVTSNLKEGRTPIRGLHEVKNMELTQDGMVEPRANLCELGEVQFSDLDSPARKGVRRLLGTPVPFSRRDPATNRVESHLIGAFLSLDGEAIVAYLNREQEDRGWVQISTTRGGEPFTPSMRVDDAANLEFHFSVNKNYITITNGEVSFIDLSKDTLEEVVPIAIPNPTVAPTVTSSATISEDTVQIVYAYSIQTEYGETAISPSYYS